MVVGGGASRFTCDLLVESYAGSELYPTSCTQSSELRELAAEIAKRA